MYKFRINQIEFRDGLAISPEDVLVLVGPNNVGKSRALKDIVSLIAPQNRAFPQIIVRKINCDVPHSLEELRTAYAVERHPRLPDGASECRTIAPTLCEEFRMVSGGKWPPGEQDPLANADPPAQDYLLREFGPCLVAYLSTEDRLRLVKENPSPSHEHERSNLLQQLFYAGRETESRVRCIVKTAFEYDVALDFSTLSRLQIRLAGDFRDLPPDPRDAGPILNLAAKLDEQGDGIRSFVGVVVALLAAKRDLVLIDEPEAFLHPPQSFRIGETISERSNESQQILVATHSVDVLRGILSKKQNQISIIRLDRDGDRSAFRMLDPARIKEVMTDPLLSSARVLDGLFYRGSVVVEADSDARFYQSVSRKCDPALDLHFVNADNKQTVPRILAIYRELGVASAGIVDIDILNDPAEFDKQLEAAGIKEPSLSSARSMRSQIAQTVGEESPEARISRLRERMEELQRLLPPEATSGAPTDATAMRKSLRQLESKLHEALDTIKVWAEIKRRGAQALPAEVRPQFLALSDICAKGGFFINPEGELESMLVDYGIRPTTDKRAWIQQALGLLPGLNVDRTKYPWKFIVAIHDYLTSSGNFAAGG